jgi:hypothetical protein
MMVDAMKWIILLLCSFPVLGGLADVKAVYLLPMMHGMDQYLANHLVKAGFYQVVTDPKRADAVFADRVGEAVENQLKELYPEPKPAAKKKEEDTKDSSEVTGYAGAAPHTSSLSAGKGNIFLIDVKSRAVVWSTYARPKQITPQQLDQAAARVVESLDETLHPKPKK